MINDQIQESIDLVLTYVRMAWRNRWWALILASVICAVGWVYVMALPDNYKVSTKIFLDTRTMLTPVLSGIALPSSASHDAGFMIQRTLLIRPNLESIIRKTDMDLQAKTPEQFEQLVAQLRKGISIGGTAQTNIYHIAYSNESPKLALKVVESLLNIFVEKSLGDARKDTTQTKQFLDSQIGEYESKLLAAENRLKEFKRRNRTMLPGSSSGYFSRLSNAKSELKGAELALEEMTRRRDALKAQVAGEEPTFGLGPASRTTGSAASTALDQRIAALEQQIDALLVQYTDLHPDVVATKRLIQRLIEEREAERESIKAMTDEGAGDGFAAEANQNPVYQSIKMALSQSEADVAALQSRVEEYRKRVLTLEKLVDTVPQIEAEFGQLNRDYNVDKKNYDALVNRRESLKISEDASESAGAIKFNILEPPREPVAPSSPDRQILYAIVLGAALAGGAVLALALGMFRPAFFSKDSVTRYAQLPVLGSVSRIWTPKERFRRRLEIVAFGIGCVALFVAFASVEVISALDVDLSAKLNSVIGRVL